MKDDPKIFPLGTNYKPETPPSTVSDVTALQWSVVQLSEEIERLSKNTQALVKVLKNIVDRLDTADGKLDTLLER